MEGENYSFIAFAYIIFKAKKYLDLLLEGAKMLMITLMHSPHGVL